MIDELKSAIRISQTASLKRQPNENIVNNRSYAVNNSGEWPKSKKGAHTSSIQNAASSELEFLNELSTFGILESRIMCKGIFFIFSTSKYCFNQKFRQKHRSWLESLVVSSTSLHHIKSGSNLGITIFTNFTFQVSYQSNSKFQIWRKRKYLGRKSWFGK
jgi:hypothetical protein